MWKLRTNKGRVVYEREKHEFKWSDVARIANKVESPSIWEQGFLREYWNLFKAAGACLEKIQSIPIRTMVEGFERIGEGNLDDSLDRPNIFDNLLRNVFGFENKLDSWRKDLEQQ